MLEQNNNQEQLEEPEQEPEQLEEEPEEQESEETGPNFTSPEAILMLMFAVVLDIISIIPAINLITTVVGLVVFGLWMIFRSGNVSMTKGVQKIGKKIFKRLGITSLIELIPVVPGWTVMVFLELKDG